MKKLILLILIFITSFLLSSCKKDVKCYDLESIDEFDILIEEKNAVRYDLRLPEDCEKGHIPKFMCMRTINNEGVLNPIEDMVENIKILYDKDKIIILISEDGVDAKKLAQLLGDEGYNNVNYFSLGYNDYVNSKGSNFIPEEGCNC